MASIGPCFMVTWTIFKNHLLELGLTQNRETMVLRMLDRCDNPKSFIEKVLAHGIEPHLGFSGLI